MKLKKNIPFLILSCLIGCTSPTTKKENQLEQIAKRQNIEINELREKKRFNQQYNFSEKELQKFNNWIDSTIKESKNNQDNAIIIDKAGYTLYLIKNGKVDSKFPIELGFNPYDNKEIEGDGCTPEGFYKVSKKLPLGYTNFHKAFLLNYPNSEDLEKGKTGSLIEIHGYGSGNKGNENGYNWTLGCTALSNQDMNKIFPYIQNNDRITIVKYSDNEKLKK